MPTNYFKYLSKSFSKTTGLSVRLYQKEKMIYYYSPAHVTPDPATVELDKILSSPHRAGIITNNLFQHYGYAHMKGNHLVIIGPTAVLSENPQEFASLLFLLGIPEDQKHDYLCSLCCSPEITAQRLAWILSFCITAWEKKSFDVENVYISTTSVDKHNPIAREHTQAVFNTYEDDSLANIVITSYRFERLANSYIKNGQVEKIRELFDALPNVQAGKMASDVLRQTKNMFICSATTMSRASIDGGLDPQSAFNLSDLYIQKCEVIREPTAIQTLIQEMTLDFAERVRSLNYGNAKDSKLFEDCSFYVRKHLFERIRVNDMAEAFGISRSYLSSQFHEQTGKTLTDFILEQKILEAKQLLQHSNKSIADIGMHLAFSSQSHFQNVFKKLIQMTPLEYRKQFQ